MPCGFRLAGRQGDACRLQLSRQFLHGPDECALEFVEFRVARLDWNEDKIETAWQIVSAQTESFPKKSLQSVAKDGIAVLFRYAQPDAHVVGLVRSGKDF
jgi:hypothetical protein